jgi:hypothetical protein
VSWGAEAEGRETHPAAGDPAALWPLLLGRWLTMQEPLGPGAEPAAHQLPPRERR